MAEDDDQHEGDAPGAGDEGPAGAGPRARDGDEALAPDAQLEGWVAADGPEGAVRSWSEIAELDEADDADGSGEVRLGPDGKAIGGLLGVDSGLLRFLENEDDEAARPSVAVRSGADDDDGGALPADLGSSDAPGAYAAVDADARPIGGAEADEPRPARAPDAGALPLDLDLLVDDEGPALFDEDEGDEAEEDTGDPGASEGGAPGERAPPPDAESGSGVTSEAAPPAARHADRVIRDEPEEDEDDGAEWISSVVADLDLGADLGADWAGGVVDDAVLQRARGGWSRLTSDLSDDAVAEEATDEPADLDPDEETWVVEEAGATGADLLLPGGLEFIPADDLDLEELEPVPDGIYEGDAEQPEMIDTWGEDAPPPPRKPRTGPLPGTTAGQVDELDPFAVSAAASLQDETGTLDPFDSLGASVDDVRHDWLEMQGPRRPGSAPPPRLDATPGSDPPSAAPAPQVTTPAANVEAPAPIAEADEETIGADEPGELPSASVPGFSLLAPSDDSVRRDQDAEDALPQAEPPDAATVERALADLGERSVERRAVYGELEASGDVMRLEEVLQDTDDRRVVRVEYADLESLELGPDEAADVLEADVIEEIDLDLVPAAVDRRTALEALSQEPVELQSDDLVVDVPRVPPPLPPPVELEVAEADVLESVSSDVHEPDDGPWLDDSVRPSWGEGAPEPMAFTEDVERLGVPFLGAIPPFSGPAAPQQAFPIGALPLVEAASPEGPPVLPQLIEPRGDPTGPGRHLYALLKAEIATEVDRPRLALLLHELGWLAESTFDDPELAVQAYRAAHTNDREFALNRWALHRMLERSGGADEVVALLARRGKADPDASYRAGHLALSALGDPERALALWQRANDSRPDWLPPLLARYATSLNRLDWEGAARVLDDALEACAGPVLRGLLALERARLEGELGDDPQRLDALYNGAVDRLGGTPALVATVERHAFEHGNLELLLRVLRARYDRVMSDFDAGRVDEPSAQWEVGEVFYKAAWTFERLGRNADALREYHNALRTLPSDRFIRYRAGELARRLGKADEHREHLAELARQATDPAEAANTWYQMGLIAQQVLADETKSREDFERAVEVLPTFTPALAALGRQALRQGRFQEVQRRFNQEIRQLESSLGEDLSEEVRERTIRGLVHRYYRVARLLEQQLDVSDTALEYDKRALSIAPDFLPSFIAMERIFEGSGRYKELTALYLGRAERGLDDPEASLPLLLAAADVVTGRLGDARNGARMYARALAIEPDHPYALRRASEAFAAIGNHAARVEVDLRWGRLGDARSDERLLRAAQLQELDGDSLAAAAEALVIYRDALDRLPDAPAAIDGLVRVTARLGRAGELAQQVERHDLGSLETPALVLALAEALLAGGRMPLAARVIRRWRDRRADSPAPPAVDRALLDLMAIAHERGEAWRPLVDALEEQASRAEPTRASSLLARVGELWEMRLDEPGLAADAYARALLADSECAAALSGERRLSFHRRPDSTSVPVTRTGELLLSARAAEAVGDRETRNQALLELADEVPDALFGAALREVADAEGRSLDEVAEAFDRAPRRRDRFEDCLSRVSADGRDEAVGAVLRRRLPHDDAAGTVGTLTSLLGHCLATGDDDGVRNAAWQLLEIDQTSLPAMFALRRVAQVSGDDAEKTVAGERLLAVLQAPGPAARTHLHVALEAEAAGASPARVRALLEQAVSLDPGADAPAAELARRLEQAEEWHLLVELYEQRLEAVTDPDVRRQIARARAEVFGEHLGDSRAALEAIQVEIDDASADADTTLLGATYADRLELYDEADRLFALAAAADAGRRQSQARLAHARSLARRGASGHANSVLDALLLETPRDFDAVELKAEVMAAQRNWRGVLEAYRRLFAMDVDPVRRAERAMAIGEVLARVLGDHRAAAGWFKRAVELHPLELRGVWRMLEEVEAAPQGSIPHEHIDDAVDRAIGAVRARHAEDPGDADALRQLARLYRRRGQPDACFLACAALEYLGAANEVERAFYRQRRQRVSGDFARPMGPDLRRELLVHPGEAGSGRAVFDAFSLVLSELLSDRVPQGLPRLSRRSFAEWQEDFRQLAAGLGVEDIELWNGGSSVDSLRACYLPQPALIVPTRMLEGRIDAAESFILGNMVEGLRDGRLLFERHGGRLVERCVSVMAAEVSPGLMPAAPEDGLASPLRARLVDRARRLPRRLKLQLDALVREREGKQPPNVAALAEAIAHTRDRAGLLCAGDIGAALDRLVFPDPAAAASARQTKGAVAEALRGSKAARALLVYALSPAHIKLRAILGLAVS